MATKDRQMPARDSGGRFISKSSDGHQRMSEGRSASDNGRGNDKKGASPCSCSKGEKR
ncbi:MAG: hypothetical protein J1E80_01710 [Desulfovibrionaceae bacterium]|nr:hypothetical protein [Desulfovibrionaceae bacterium]